jgi:hypothetical protein
MDSNNPYVRNFYRKCCLWGKRTPLKLEKPYQGGPVPLLRSPQKKFFIAMTVINLLVFLILIISYVVQFKLSTSSNKISGTCLQIDSVYVTILVFACVNTLWYLFLARVETASDQEWHKYIVFMVIDSMC